MRSNYKRLGDYIKEVDIRNSNLSTNKLIGVSIEKKIISSVANIIGTDMATYKIIQNGQFACKLMSVGRDEKLPIDLYLDDEKAIVSSAYFVFEPQDTNLVLADYLLMWLSRTENDRYVGFISGGDVRGGISWEMFCEIPIKVPAIHVQRKIVEEYHIIVNRINLNNQLIQKLEETAQAIYKQWFVDFEFPDKNGKPYKSSGGEMEFNEELEKEIPKGWSIITIKEFSKDVHSGGTPSRDNLEYWNNKDIPWLKTGEVANKVIIEAEEYISKKGLQESSARLFPINTVLVAMYGEGKTKGQSGYLRFEATTNQACCAIICEHEGLSSYLFYFLRANQARIANLAIGGAQPNLSKDLIEKIKILKPSSCILYKHPFIRFIDHCELLERENIFLKKMKSIMLSKLATIEN